VRSNIRQRHVIKSTSNEFEKSLFWVQVPLGFATRIIDVIRWKQNYFNIHVQIRKNETKIIATAVIKQKG
jgi:hypothetical protein